ncbi:type IV pilin [Methanoregula sp.]
MVVITVILAAVTIVFVFGVHGTIQRTKLVSIGITRYNTSDVIVTDEGGPDARSLSSVFWTVDNDYTTWQQQSNPKIGSNIIIHAKQGQDLMIMGKFSDGSSELLYNRDV